MPVVSSVVFQIMHVLYFHQYFSTRQGGTGTRSYEMARRLIYSGHQVTMVCASYGPATTGLSGPFVRGKRQGDVDGIQVIEFELPCSNSDGLVKRAWTFVKYAIQSARLAVFTKCDLVFATSTPLTAAIPGIASAWLRRRRFVFEVRDLWPELPRAMGIIRNPLILGAMGFLERRAYHAATHCIGLAPGISQGIEKHIDEDRVTTIPNGCDLDLLEIATHGSWRPDGVSKDDFLAIFTGTHGKANGLSAVLDAAAVLKKRGRDDIKLLLVGDGKEKDDLLRRAKLEELGNVIFQGRVSKHKAAGLLGGADAGMQILANVPAFYYGTSPNKFFDYLSVGLPALNNYPGWVAELVGQNGCGIAVPPDDPEAFANALEYLAEHRAKRKLMGQAARELAEREFSRDELAAKFVKVLEEAAA
ncbi:MAG: glycosyltransferase family 4 protein [Aureliella sp.]